MNRERSKRSATDHTVVIGDVPSMYWKLLWDIDQFDSLQRNDPEFMAPLAYAAINVCIAANSLRDWVVTEIGARDRLAGKKPEPAKVTIKRIYAQVPHQKMCDAIAATAKHSRFDEQEWHGGSVRIELFEPTEDDPGGYILRHGEGEGRLPGIGLNSFMAMKGYWRDALEDWGFPVPLESPDWWQGKMRRIFGDRLD